jgi:uncharacterized protein YjaG (DUF416 family)
MVLYKRIPALRLKLLKGGFFLIVLAIVILFESDLKNGLYFCIVSMLLLSFYHTKDFILFDDRLEIRHYFFFNLFFSRKTYLKTDNTIIKGEGSYFGQRGDYGEIADDSGTGIGCLLSVFSIFSVPTTVKRTFSFKKIKNDKVYISDIDLSQNEFAKLREWITTSQAGYVMNYAEFSNAFRMQIIQMPFEKRLNFGILISKKLYPDYEIFSEEEKWGNPEIITEAIALCEKSRDTEIDLSEFELMMEKVGEVTPDMDDFGSMAGSCALNACVAIHETLEFLVTKEWKPIMYVGIAYYDTQEARLWDDDFTDAELDQHPAIIETRKFLLKETSK